MSNKKPAPGGIHCGFLDHACGLATTRVMCKYHFTSEMIPLTSNDVQVLSLMHCEKNPWSVVEHQESVTKIGVEWEYAANAPSPLLTHCLLADEGTPSNELVV